MRNDCFTVKQKDSFANVVTSHDVEIQAFLCKELACLLPGCGFLCEENDLIQTQGKEYVFVIDPIDGTANYAHGVKESAISVALLQNGKPLVGVVYNPFHDEMFYAEAGKGSYLNGKPIHASQRVFADGLFCTAMSLYQKAYAPLCAEIIMGAYLRCSDIRRFGSCALELCYLAAGRCDLYFEIRVFPWDYAAAFLILSEAGGILKGFRGESLAFDKPTPLIGANTAENYEELQNIVCKKMKEVPYEEKL